MAKPDKSKKHGECDDNTERPLIDLIKTLLTVEFKKVNDALENFGQRLQQQEQKQDQIMTALEDLQAALNEATTAQTDLTTAVNAAIVKLGTTPVPVDEAAITAAAVAVRANTASDVSLKDALNTALGTPPTT